MPLINCPECKEQISDKAPFCPKCGCPRQHGFMKGWACCSWGFEWKSSQQLFGWPLVHITLGFDKKTNRLLVSKGIIAIGQFGIGAITIAQIGIGILFAFGQIIGGLCAVGQIACGVLFGLGQFATGITAIGQFGFGQYVRAMFGVGEHLWTIKIKDPVAVEYFNRLFEFFKLNIG